MYNLIKKLTILCLFLMQSNIAFSDDVDIYGTTSSQEVNVLFILDGSKSMEQTVSGGTKTRMAVMQNTLRSVLSTAPDFLKIGVMSYGTTDAEGGRSELPNGIKFPIKPINELVRPIIAESITVNGTADWTLSTVPEPSATTTVRELVSDIADAWSPSGLTPIVDSLYEAALYFRGDRMKFGFNHPSQSFAAHPATYTKPEPNPVPPIGWDVINYDSCKEIVSDFTWSGGDDDTAIRDYIAGLDNPLKCSINPFSSPPTAPFLANNCTLAVNKTCYTNQDCINSSCQQTNENGDCISYGECTAYGESYRECEIKKCVPELKLSPKYISPITNECQSNNIILMSDGKPEYNLTDILNVYPHAVSESKISQVIGNTNCVDKPDGFAAGKCGPELTQYLATHDNAPGKPIPGDQYIDTLVIGFSEGIGNDAKSYLKSLVTIPDDLDTAGKEGYFSATNEVELADAFKQAIQAIKVKDINSYSAATYSLASSISLTHGNHAYIPLFEHSGGASWSGNLKKYELIDDQLYGLDATGTKVRATTDDGVFIGNVSDLWATTITENKVTTGGFANKIDPANRKALTNNGASIIDINAATNTQLGVSTKEEHDNLINYIKGKKADDSARHHMGDIVHGKPVQLRVRKSDDSLETILFVGTNEGYVHAIQADTGDELFAFMPRTLLSHIKPQYNGTAQSNHIYGVDGQITLLHDDANHNGIKEAGEKATIFFGLRRGGQAYYALDVTNSSNPKLLWEITPSSTGFSSLGLTWSIPTLHNLTYQTSASSTLHKGKPVLIFGGGYIDDHLASNPVNTGVGVYIVDAISGTLLHKYTHADMSEVPSKIRALDIDRNGSIDRLYFGDTNANIWRIDLNANSASPYNLEKSQLFKFAELGGTDADDRSFFAEADVALFKHKGKFAITISIGSGLRPDPLNKDIEDHFFMLLDEHIFTPPATNHPKITIGDLLDAPVTDRDLVSKLSEAGSKKGWKLKLNSISSEERTGEKSLSAGLTYQNKILFTTFSAEKITSSSLIPDSSASCSTASSSNSKLYALELLSGKPTLNLNTENSSDLDAWTTLNINKIPGTPQIRFSGYTSSKGGACTNDDCQRNQSIKSADTTTPLQFDSSLPRIYWINEG